MSHEQYKDGDPLSENTNWDIGQLVHFAVQQAVSLKKHAPAQKLGIKLTLR